MIKPNLWITGLPKAGTSSLFENLVQHPLIGGCHPKETFYLLDKDSILLNSEDNYWKSSIAGWRNFFTPDTLGNVRYYLEGTTHLLFQNHSLDVLKTYHPASRFIIMLREPSERIYSSFIYTRDSLVRIPPNVTFAEYVSDLLAQRPLNYVRAPVSRFVLSRELEYSRYAVYLRLWYERFNDAQIFIGLFEEFVKDHRAFMRRLFSFLELEDVEIAARHSNPSRGYKNSALHRVLLGVANVVPKTPFRMLLKKAYVKTFSAPTISLSEEDIRAKKELKDYFRSHNLILENEFHLNISRWNE